MQTNVYEITEDRCLRPIEADSISQQWLADDVHRWIDLAEFQEHELEALLEPLELQQEIMDACLVQQSRPRVITLENILFVSIPVQADKDNLSYLTFLCGPTILVTIQHSNIYYMDDLALNYVHNRRLIAANTAGLVFELLDQSLNRVAPVVYSLRERIVAMWQLFEDDMDAVEFEEITALSREAVKIEILFQDQQYCLSDLLIERSQSFALDTIRAALTELIARLERGTSALTRHQDWVRDLQQFHRNYMQENTNRRLGLLTLLSAIYLPPTLIAGIYGMNFENIPITSTSYGYGIVMVAMILVVVGQLTYFRSRGWFK